MRYRLSLISTYLVITFTACINTSEREHALNIAIKHKKKLEQIPSGSGSIFYQDSLWVVGDNVTQIYKLSLVNYSYSSFFITGSDTTLQVVPKTDKQDLEAVCVGEMNDSKQLFAFGSGSKIPQRDSLLVVSLEERNKQSIYSLKRFYEYLRKQAHLLPEQWNIEAATIVGDSLLLINRGDNRVFVVAWEAFAIFLHNGTLPSIHSFTLELPKYNRHLARVSGATTLKNGTILFCASIEDTDDWYSDGEVLGSYIGVFDLKTQKVTDVAMLKTKDGAAYNVKLESLAVTKEEPTQTKIVAIADNDDGSTLLLHLDITPSTIHR